MSLESIQPSENHPWKNISTVLSRKRHIYKIVINALMTSLMITSLGI